MQFLKCTASKTGLFDNTTLSLTNGLNIIYGKNGSGKSLLAKGMMEGVWKNFLSDAPILGDTWNNMYLDLLLSISDHKYKIINNYKNYKIQHIKSNFETHTIYSDDINNINDTDQSNIDGKKNLKNFIDTCDLHTFQNSSFLNSPSDININKIICYKTLKNIILKDSSDFYYFHNYFRKVTGNDDLAESKLLTEISNYENKLKELNKEMKIIEIQNSRKDKLNREKNNIKRDIDKLNNSLTSFTSQKEILGNILKNLDKIDLLNKNLEIIKEKVLDEQRKIDSISIMKAEVEELFPQFNNLAISDTKNLDKLQEIFIQIRNVNEKIDTFHFNKKLKKHRLKKTASILNSIFASAIFYILYKNNFSIQQDIITLAAILGITILSTPLLFLYYSISTNIKKLDVLKLEKDELSKKLKLTLEKNSVKIEGYKLSELYNFLLQYFEDYIDYSERIKDIIDLENSIEGKNHLTEIEEKLDSLRKEEESIKNEINISIESLDNIENIELNNFRINEITYNIDSKIDSINDEIIVKKNILEKIDNEISINPIKNNEMNHLISQKEETEKILNKLYTNKNSTTFILEIMTDAVNKLENKQLNKLINSTSSTFNFLTRNQYAAKINEDSIRQIITKNIIPENSNSTLIHILLLSIKFSITDFLIDGNISLPLIIDEPFQFMDSERIACLKELLLDISRKRQVLIFTHQSDLKDWGNYTEL